MIPCLFGSFFILQPTHSFPHAPFSGHRRRRNAVHRFIFSQRLRRPPVMDKVFNKLRNLDAYPKVNEDFYNRTLAGGVVTVVSAAVMLFLFFSELSMAPRLLLFLFLIFFLYICWNSQVSTINLL